jgi:aryl-alcohol dehydrogenase-like predicted oxidoreductase
LSRRAQAHERGIIHLAVRWMLDRGVSVALWGGPHPEQMQPTLGVTGWSLDLVTLALIDRILEDTITNPVGPGFMVPPVRS